MAAAPVIHRPAKSALQKPSDALALQRDKFEYLRFVAPFKAGSFILNPSKKIIILAPCVSQPDVKRWLIFAEPVCRDKSIACTGFSRVYSCSGRMTRTFEYPATHWPGTRTFGEHGDYWAEYTICIASRLSHPE